MFLERKLLPVRIEGVAADPAPVSRPPVSPAGIPHVMAEQERFQTLPGLFQIPSGGAPGADQVTERFALDGRHVDRRQVPGAQRTHLFCSITSVGLDALARFPGNQ